MTRLACIQMEALDYLAGFSLSAPLSQFNEGEQ